jgi:hypothetical protein
VAAFLFDSSSADSFRRAVMMMETISTAAGETLPCAFVACKDDLGMAQVGTKDAAGFCPDRAWFTGLMQRRGTQGHMSVVESEHSSESIFIHAHTHTLSLTHTKQALETDVATACIELAVPLVPVSVEAGELSGLLRRLVTMSMRPEGFIPCTPARKVREREWSAR